MVHHGDLELSTLAEASRAITHAAHDPQELAETAFLETARLIPSDYFQLGVFEDDSYRTLIRVHDGDQVDNVTLDLTKVEDLALIRTRQQHGALLVHDFQEEFGHLPITASFDDDAPPVSALYFPLWVEASILGAIVFHSRASAIYNEQHIQLLNLLGPSLTAALLHQHYREHTASLTLHMVLVQEVSRLLMAVDPLHQRLQQVTSLAAEVLGFSQVEIYATVEDQLSLHSSSSPGVAEMPTTIPEVVRHCVEIQERTLQESPDSSGSTSAYEIAFPLTVVEHSLGVMYVCSSEYLDVETERVTILEMLANQIAFSMLEAQNYDARQEEAWMTTVLLEVAKHAAQPGDTMIALQAVLQLATLLAGTDWAILLVPGDPANQLTLGPSAGVRREDLLRVSDLHLDRAGFVAVPALESEGPGLIDLPPDLADVLNQSQAHCLTLSDGQELLGLLLMKVSPLPGLRPSLLAGIGHQVSLRLENARLIEKAALQRSLERELMMARTIQASFLPEFMPDITGWELAAAWELAREVGGDFYDIIPLPSGSDGERWGIVIADVADKGIPAALYMALCRTMLRSVAQSTIQPGQTLEMVNRQLISDTRADLFVSVFYGVWEPQANRISYANAGHPPPLLFKPNKRAILLEEHGMVLGVRGENSYSDQTLDFEPSDLLVLFTDGVSEAQDSDHELFGYQRVESLILSQESWNANSISQAIVERVTEFGGGGDFSDDLTAVTIRRVH